METTSVLTALRGAEYLGSHPRASRRVSPVDIVFTTSGISMMRGRYEFGTLRWESLTDLKAATWDHVERRITTSRTVLLGLWALLVPKRTRFAYLMVSDDEGEWAFAVPGITAGELRAGIAPLRAYVR